MIVKKYDYDTDYMRINLTDIQRELDDQSVKITLFDSIDSTSSWLLEHGAHGDICLSEAQTAGRGRRGNEWISPEVGNIYFSMCWNFEEITEHWSLLGLVVGVAIADTLKEIGLKKHGIKWPNDIFWKEKKLGGILLESDQPGRVVIGVGLNINMSDEVAFASTQKITQPWISLQKAMEGEKISRNQVVAVMINYLRSKLSGFSHLKIRDFLNEWKTWDVLAGRMVSIQRNGVESSGKVMGINEKGQIGVLMQNQETQFFSSAEIKLVPQKNI